MKTSLFVFFFSFNLFAGERIILQDQKIIDTEINRETVRCSAKGYGMAELKINIAALDGWTIFDHSNVSFGDRSNLPCMTAGLCKFQDEGEGFDIDDVIQGKERIEKIVVERIVTESRNVTVIDGFKVCERSLMEKLKTTVGGVEFHHARGGAEQNLPEKACHF